MNNSGQNETVQDSSTKFRFKRLCTKKKIWNTVTSTIPILQWLPSYKWSSDLVPDFFAGLTLAFLNVPQALAFAVLANAPLTTGLYTACFSAFVYALLGTASVSSFGPVAIGSMLTGETVAVFMTERNMSATPDGTIEDHTTRVTFIATLTFTIGLIYVVFYILNMGTIRALFTKPFVSGFITGCAIHILAKSVKMLFGIRLKSHYGPFVVYKNFRDVILKLPDSHVPTVIFSVVVIMIFVLNMFVLKRLVAKCTKFIVPIEAIVLVVSIITSYFADFRALGFETVGYIPSGVSSITVSPIDPSLIPTSFPAAVTLSTINMATTLSMVLAFNSDKLRAGQEILAMSVSNLICSNLQCMIIGNSMMRTIVAINLGIKTLMATIVSSIILLFVLMFAGPLFEPLPTAALGCIIIVAIVQLIITNLKQPPSFFKKSFEDGAIWAVVFATTVFWDIQIGLITGFVLTLRQLLVKVIGDEEEKKKRLSQAEELHSVEAIPEGEKLLEEKMRAKVVEKR
ncbi:Sulfate transporter [Nesidiocoris tenuis]|uniref:Sulfate transporter n=1 Tax=Nesidiocoris tenuis TaxID=355587 RepID=A0ABN7AZT0_9HEMI|nr:Sulfate transporter [Nesidiocoris tenuis]